MTCNGRIKGNKIIYVESRSVVTIDDESSVSFEMDDVDVNINGWVV